MLIGDRQNPTFWGRFRVVVGARQRGRRLHLGKHRSSALPRPYSYRGSVNLAEPEMNHAHHKPATVGVGVNLVHSKKSDHGFCHSERQRGIPFKVDAAAEVGWDFASSLVAACPERSRRMTA